MEKVKVKLLKPLYPYEEGEIAEMREEVAKMWASKGYVEIMDKKGLEKIEKEDVAKKVVEKTVENPEEKIILKKDKSMENRKNKKNKAL